MKADIFNNNSDVVIKKSILQLEMAFKKKVPFSAKLKVPSDIDSTPPIFLILHFTINSYILSSLTIKVLI